MKLRDLGEGALIDLLLSELGGRDLIVPIGDDGAVYDLDSARQVAVADAMIEHVHFDRAFCPLDTVGRKLVAVNVSDVAAMGALPDTALFTAGLPGDLDFAQVRALVAGVAAEAREQQVTVVGGDVTGSPGPISLSLTLLGSLVGEEAVLRGGARPGDTIWVTAPLGAAALGLQALQGGFAGDAPESVSAFLRPRVGRLVGATLGRWGRCHAMMDLSDGLSQDAPRMARAAGATLEIDLARVPIAPEVRRLVPDQALGLAVHGGEDYALMFTCADVPPLPMLAIGRVLAGPPEVRWVRGSERCPPPPRTAAFDHFR